MTHLLCRNRVADVDIWHEVFQSHKQAHLDAGLVLEYLWREDADPNNIFFLFRVDDLGKARAFISAPHVSSVAEEAGVLDGDFHFLEGSVGY